MAVQNRNVLPLDLETQFDIRELFFSTTDTCGVIQHGNEVFVRVSGYTVDDLIGKPHSLVRHPDMPRSVFQLLWETIQAGKTIAAYVKNLAKDGTYYWVLALVLPCDSGYLSIRLKPTSPLFEAVQKIYCNLAALERSLETEPKRRRAAMEAARAALQEQLTANGFANYETFMLHALSVELASRNQRLSQADEIAAAISFDDEDSFAEMHAHCQSLDHGLKVVFERLEKFKAMNLELAAQSTEIRSSAESIRFLSMNASVTANKLGVKAATLQVVSKSLGTVCDDSRQLMFGLSQRMADVIEILERLIFDLAATKLQSEVLLQFVIEIRTSHLAQRGPQDSAVERLDPNLERSLATLACAMSTRMQQVFAFLDVAEKRMAELADDIEKLYCNIRILRFVQFAGEKEAAAWNEAKSFALVFQQIRQHIDRTKSECDTLRIAILDSCQQVRDLRTARTTLRPHLDSLLTLRQGACVPAVVPM